MKGALTTGAYQSRSVIAANQRCKPVRRAEPADSEFPVTYSRRLGFLRRAVAPSRGFRGLYAASNGELYAVVSSKLYSIDVNWTFTERARTDDVHRAGEHARQQHFARRRRWLEIWLPGGPVESCF